MNNTLSGSSLHLLKAMIMYRPYIWMYDDDVPQFDRHVVDYRRIEAEHKRAVAAAWNNAERRRVKEALSARRNLPEWQESETARQVREIAARGTSDYIAVQKSLTEPQNAQNELYEIALARHQANYGSLMAGTFISVSQMPEPQQASWFSKIVGIVGGAGVSFVIVFWKWAGWVK